MGNEAFRAFGNFSVQIRTSNLLFTVGSQHLTLWGPIHNRTSSRNGKFDIVQ